MDLQQIIDECNKIVFFGGAGVSTESGIPDFRSVDGLYNQKYDYPPEEILSHTFFYSHTIDFFKFYRQMYRFSSVFQYYTFGGSTISPYIFAASP